MPFTRLQRRLRENTIKPLSDIATQERGQDFDMEYTDNTAGILTDECVPSTRSRKRTKESNNKFDINNPVRYSGMTSGKSNKQSANSDNESAC